MCHGLMTHPLIFFAEKPYRFYVNNGNVYVDFNTPYLLKKQKRYYLCTEEIYFFTNLTK